eukprot:677760_1
MYSNTTTSIGLCIAKFKMGCMLWQEEPPSIEPKPQRVLTDVSKSGWIGFKGETMHDLLILNTSALVRQKDQDNKRDHERAVDQIMWKCHKADKADDSAANHIAMLKPHWVDV